GHATASPIQPSKSPLRRSFRSYSVVFFQAPNADALGQKLENERRNLRLEGIADGHTRRWISLLVQGADALRDQFRFWRNFHVVIDRLPCFRQLCFVSRIVVRA